nr:hypothetical protein [uncultured Brumimicrobium sp.]
MLRIRYINYHFQIVIFLILSGLSFGQNPANYPVEHLCNLDLNRTASKLTPTQLATVAPAIKGFVWNTGDKETDKFRPQGITDITLGCKKFIAVSWYGRKSNEETLWTLTEYGTNEGINNNRIVFSLSKTDIMPPENDMGIQGNDKNKNISIPKPNSR